MPNSECLITGTLYTLDNQIAKNAKLTIIPVSATGVVLVTNPIEVVSDENGEVSFTCIQGTQVRIKSDNVLGYTDSGVIVTIPDEEAYDLEDLTAVAQATASGIRVFNDNTPLSQLIGTLKFVGFQLEIVSPGVLQISLPEE